MVVNKQVPESSISMHPSHIENVSRNRDNPDLTKLQDTQEEEHEIGLKLTRARGFGKISCKLLFRKELTPSDVGKLNRLVIPKKSAVKYFAPIPEKPEDSLHFHDKSMKRWKFRFCYWESSQSYVFTKGWSGFVKEKGLKASDIITFFDCECEDQNYIRVIDVCLAGLPRVAKVREEESSVKGVDVEGDSCLQIGQNSDRESVQEVNGDRKKRVKLFGADIS